MHLIVIVSYLTAAAAYLAGTVLLGISWRGQRTGVWLILAMMVSTLWGLFLTYSEWQGTIAAAWLLAAEILRYGAWLIFVSALFNAWPMSGMLRRLRVLTHVLWILLALYCLWPAIGLPQPMALAFSISVPLVGILVLALLGVVFLEQIYRNVQPEQRWALKFLVIALGALFAYDIFLYSYAALYRQFNLSAWAARGFINALLVPLLLVAAARNSQWSLQVAVSRRIVFYTTSLLVVAFYIIATAVGGYYVRMYGGNWGRVAEIALICFALLVLLLVVFSGQARSRLRIFLYKNFFNFRHDYREEWLRLTTTLATAKADLSTRCILAMAQIMDSPAGVLLMYAEGEQFVLEAAWNMPTPPSFKLPASFPVFEFIRERQWIYDLSQSPPLQDERLRAPVELSALPRAWLIVPLMLETRLIGLLVLAQARARRRLDWEDIDLLRAAGSQVASTLAQADNAKRLAEARQFEGFNRLTAFLMHDLKNLAAQQSLLLQNAERHKHNPAFVDDMLTTVNNSVRRISRLLEQLRGGVVPAATSRVRLAAVIDKALIECARQKPHPNYQPATEELWVRAEAEQLATILGHIIRNAQEATQPDGHVALRLRHIAGYALIEIEDDGTGMDEEFVRHRLFQPFYTTKASRGMGIGAYQAREYVRSLGGTINVNSAPGRGTVFGIQLPLAETAVTDQRRLAS